MATPEIFARAGLLDAGTVMVMMALGSSISPCRSAAVWWLRTAPGPARSRAAQSTVSRAGSPEKAAYTPRCSRCHRPLRTAGPHRLRVDAHILTLSPGDGGGLSLKALRERFG